MTGRELAVVVSRACKYYGREDKPDYKPVLRHFNMTVERGIIYGLLGPSGCGKTTLLSCIVGRRQLDSGEVWVLGGRPGEKGSGVPGPRVGYMPQDIALVGEFTVRDAVYYFGRIYGMKMKKLSERFEFLSSLLDLPPAGRLIKSMSGGQQRRVSLAAALVHEPELLILDEPTVGLDPVLRERIWEFLSELARGGTTVIITTHYIDETKQAHKIGLLRDGQLLAEESPEELMRKLDCNTLEEAFLQLAMRHHEMSPRRSTLTTSPDVIPDSIVNAVESRYESREEFNIVTSSTDVLTKKDKTKECSGKQRGRYRAVFIKNIQQFSRHPGGLIFSLLFPIIQVVAFFSAVGHDPRDLHVAVVNDEARLSPFGLNICHNSSLQPIVRYDNDTCSQYMLSCWLLDEMAKTKIYQIPYNTVEQAKSEVADGKLYGAIYIPQNFSEALGERFREGDVPDDVVDESTISVWLDMTNYQISNFLKLKFHKAYEGFTKRAMIACGRPENLVQIPVHFNEPIYGKMDAQFVAFMAPGVMITIIFFLAAVVTSTLMISDRLEGVWERSAVAGVKPKEMLHVHIGIQATVILVQTIEMMLLAYAGYGLPTKGSLITCGILLFLQGLSGMCYGFLLSVCCSSYTMSFFIATGSFYPMILLCGSLITCGILLFLQGLSSMCYGFLLSVCCSSYTMSFFIATGSFYPMNLLCGIVWPLEGMSNYLRYIALTLPFTIPSKSLRAIMEKGSTILDTSVYSGFLVTVAWIVITLGLCFLRLKYKKS